MKILHVLRGLEQTSGISTFLVENANRQVAAGHEVALLYERRFEYRPCAAVEVFQGKSPARIDFRPDVVHIHGVWSFFSVWAMRWCLKFGIPFVVSPHGCLMPCVMRKGIVKKWLFYRLLLKPLLQHSNMLHATAQPEADVLTGLNLRPPKCIVPLGVDVTKLMPRAEHKVKTMLFVGRISEEKGLLNLIHAWGAVNRAEWRLVIAGPDWKGYKKTLECEILKLSLQDSVDFPGLVLGDVKERYYLNADVFVLPSPMENFSSVVLEAMSYALPVIATKGTPWAVLSEKKCGWWINQGLEPLVTAMDNAMGLSDDARGEIGGRGRELVEMDYSWDRVARRTLSIYDGII